MRGDMMRNDLKTRETIGSSIDKETLKRLREYSKKSSIPISRLLDRAISQFLETVND